MLTLLLTCLLQSAPATGSTLPTLRELVRSADLAGQARIMELANFPVETAQGTRVAVSRSKKGARLARLEFQTVWKGAAPASAVWMLAEPDYAGYSLSLEQPGASVIVFLSRGESTDPLQQQYLEKTDLVLWRAAELGRGLCAVESEALRTPAWRFEPQDGALGRLEVGSDGRVARVALSELKPRVEALVLEQREPWLRARAWNRRGEFAWKLELRKDRSYTLLIDRARGEDRVEHFVSSSCARELEAQLAKAEELEFLPRYGHEHAGQLARSVEWIGVREIELRTLDFQDLLDADYARAARWSLGLYGILRGGISEPGLLDGRVEDRKYLR